MALVNVVNMVSPFPLRIIQGTCSGNKTHTLCLSLGARVIFYVSPTVDCAGQSHQLSKSIFI